MIQKNGTSEPKVQRSAAIDITTGFAADDFILNEHPRDPWAEQSFVNFVDTAINHTEFYYPCPTSESKIEYPLDSLPECIEHLEKQRLIGSYQKVSAGEVSISKELLNKHLADFENYAFRERKNLIEWLQFHWQPTRKKKHLEVMNKDVQPYILEYWSKNKTVNRLASQISIPLDKLKYAYDVFVRGHQYFEILSGDSIAYFVHPIRRDVLSSCVDRTSEYSRRLSWGSLLSNLLREDGLLARNPEAVVNVIEMIRTKVHKEHATWYEFDINNEEEFKSMIQVYEAIADEVNLPVRIKDRVIKAITLLVAPTVGSLLDRVLNLPNIITILLTGGSLYVLDSTSIWIKDIKKDARFIRGLTERPGFVRS